ncbi:hormogonium polysaccharide biosynthesis protein HpsA [Geitlerinema sp. CS-897]|nr:hormogonium polysaccharide biosynthesis protein HpsA [Geitlerinema sp. CS-897]
MAKYPPIAMLKRWLRNTLKRAYAAFAQFLRRNFLEPLFSRRRRHRRLNPSGFVLPTAIMLLLVMALVVGAILLRTVTRTEQAILIRRDRVIYNAATPAIDRAKAKIEYMFTQDERIPQGIPSEDLLERIMLNVEENPDPNAPSIDPYTLPKEQRLDIDGDGEEDNAWYFYVDENGDGTPDDENNNGVPDLRVAYSVIWNTPDDATDLAEQSDDDLTARAGRREVRQGPYGGIPKPGCEPAADEDISRIENGWLRDPVSTAILLKNFQIDAFAIADNEDGTVTTLEVQQERQADRGNKWGAWFRNDLEIFPGRDFKWNGAMHTDGSLIIGRNQPRRLRVSVYGYLVSGPGSCLYQAGRSTSEVTLDRSVDPETDEVYEGQMVSGLVNSNEFSPGSYFHLWDESNPQHHENDSDPPQTFIDPDTDSSNNSRSVIGITLDPIVLFTEDRSAYRNPSYSASNVRDGNFEASDLWGRGRIFNQSAKRPYVDDFYRADDRYGPKPGYGSDSNLRLKSIDGVGLGVKTGEPITTAISDLTRLEVSTDEDPKDIGLDGYWERRAWREGMRVIVGQRLELGNDPFAGTTDPQQIEKDEKLTNDREHESLQRRTLRDNLAAAQTTAIYHAAEAANGTDDPPVAALVTTVHPGTAETLKRSAIFNPPQTPFTVKSDYGLFSGTFGDTPEELVVDFLTGRGTNGWQLDLQNFDVGKAEMQEALDNLAHLAGDIDGAFPAKQEAGEIHPNPALTQWGNFSNLRRTLNDDRDSFADWSNKHTAALTLGALAYNISYLDAFDYEDTTTNQPAIQQLHDALTLLGDGDTSNGEVKLIEDPDTGKVRVEVYPDGWSSGDPVANFVLVPEGLDNPENLRGVVPPPEAYIAALPQDQQELARLLNLKEQVYRDRKMGFRPSPDTPGAYQYSARFFDEDFNPDTSDVILDENDTDQLAVVLGQPWVFSAETESGDVLGLDLNGNRNSGDDDAEPKPDKIVFDDGGNLVAINEPSSAEDRNDDGDLRDINEDADLDGILDSGEDLNGNGVLDTPFQFNFTCDVSTATGNNYFGFGRPDDIASESRFLRLATSLCGINANEDRKLDADGEPDYTEVLDAVFGDDTDEEDVNENGRLDTVAKYPALYYLFPIDDHDHSTAADDLNLDGTTNENDAQPDEVFYVGDPYVSTENSSFTYKAFDATKLSEIALKPLAIDSWTLPYLNVDNPSTLCDNDASATNINPNCQQYSLVYDGVNGSYYRVGFKDTALYNGRELQSVRVLNMDLELLTDKAGGVNGEINGDTWLAGGNNEEAIDGGIVFAFREDGLREDAIEHPPGGNCRTASDIGNGCNTEVFSGDKGIDPQVNPDNGISPKPVNFVPDPDRRAHGFRILNGEDISRQGRGGSTEYGLTLISDNSAYIQGDFNCHKSPGGSCGDPIEEFNYTLSDKEDWGPDDFYNRRSNTNSRDGRFADPDNDSWRYSEFLVDGLTVLSKNFCDGSIEDPFLVVPDKGSTLDPGTSLTQALGDLNRSNLGQLNDVYGCRQTPRQHITSYLAFPRPRDNTNIADNSVWFRENPADLGSPLQISHNGNPRLTIDAWDAPDPFEYDGAYFDLDRSTSYGRPVQRAIVQATNEQHVNAIIISGITPSREKQSYGGLHNFPRFIENWEQKNLFMSGSFLQLNFSTSSSAPFDQDGWEPDATLQDEEFIQYYLAPNRLWGYDVALQLTPPGPVSSRLVTVGSTRSEYYTELPVNDPYIKKLRCASSADGEQIDARVTDCP